LGLVLLVAITVLVAAVTSISARLHLTPSAKSSALPGSASSAPAPSPSASSPLQATYPELQAGYCLQGPGLGLGTSDPWPDYFNVVPCTQRHIAEVFYADSAWPSSKAYPGDNKVNSEAEAHCDAAFRQYDGIGNSQSAFTYDYSTPDSIDWSDGDRRLVCIAYESTSQYPGGAPVSYSIKGSQQ
jgi:hypothetical protein